MKRHLLILLSLCCFGAAGFPAFAADAQQQAAAKAEAEKKAKAEAEKKAKAEAEKKAKAEAEKKAKAEAEKKAKAEAEKKAKAEAEKKSREEAARNGREINLLMQSMRKAVDGGKYDEAAAIQKKAHALAGKPGVPNPVWCYNNFGAFINLRNQKAEARAKLLVLVRDNQKFFAGKMQGNEKVDVLNHSIETLQNYVKPVPADEIAKLKAERYHVPGITLGKKFQLYVGDAELEKADAVAEEMLKEAKDGKFDYGFVINAFAKLNVFGSKFTKKWYEKQLPTLTGDAKARAIGAYASFLQAYALATDEEVAKLRESRLQVPGLTQTGKFEIALGKINSGDIDEVYAAKVKDALDAAGNDVKLRIRVYKTVLNSFWNSTTLMPNDNGQRTKFIVDVMLKDKEACATELGFFLSEYVKSNYTSFKESESFLLNYQAASPSVVRGALRQLYVTAARRYQETPDPVLLRKAVALDIQSLLELQANAPANPNYHNYYCKLRDAFKRIIETSITANDYDTAAVYLKKLGEFPNDNVRKETRVFVAENQAKIAFGREDYRAVISLLEPLVKEKAPMSFEGCLLFSKSCVATGDLEAALHCLEGNINRASYVQKRYYQPRIEMLKKRVEAAKKAGKAAE